MEGEIRRKKCERGGQTRPGREVTNGSGQSLDGHYQRWSSRASKSSTNNRQKDESEERGGYRNRRQSVSISSRSRIISSKIRKTVAVISVPVAATKVSGLEVTVAEKP